MLLLYYSVLLISFSITGSILTDEGFTNSIELNETLQEDELDQGGLFGTGISFGRYIGFVTFGIGLPGDTPTWFQAIFSTWQSLVTVFTIGFVISSIWNG